MEVKVLLEVMRLQLKGRMMKRLKENQVKIVFIGDISKFPSDIREEIHTVMQETKENTKITVVIALNYGGREEILSAVRQLIQNGEQEVSEESFRKYLYTNDIPDPDLVIRTGGEQRLSGFLSWQSIYSELYFSKTLWPDFSISELETAIAEYAIRQRRFGS
jgi:undecaprenyl diphosphate synthase